MKRRDEIGEPCRRVALRINSNKQRLHGLGRSAKLVERERNRLKLGWAHVRTIGITEIEYDELAAKIRIGAAMAGLIGKLKRTADRRAARQQAFDQLRWRWFGGFIRGNGCREKNTGERKRDQQSK